MTRRASQARVFDSEQITYVDYKDVNLLRWFMSSGRRSAPAATGSDTQQREIAAMRAREMALLVQRAAGDASQQVAVVKQRRPADGPARGGRGAGGEGAEGVEELEVLVESTTRTPRASRTATTR
jgi:ribosomal protein S18